MIIFNDRKTTIFQSRLFQLNSTVIQTNDLVLAVDPGYLPDEVEEISRFIEKIKADRPVYIFFTHSDYDHIAGFGAFPGAKTIASKEFVESPLKEKQIKDLIDYDEEFYISRLYPVKYPVIDHVISTDGQQLIIGETTITFYHAFGHTEDGLMAEIDHCLVAGDYLSDIEFPFVYFRFAEYTKTLERFKTIARNKEGMLMISCHGSPAEGTPEINKRIKDSEEYFDFMKKNPSKSEFNQFVEEKNYPFKNILWKRHRENLKLWNKEKS